MRCALGPGVRVAPGYHLTDNRDAATRSMGSSFRTSAGLGVTADGARAGGIHTRIPMSFARTVRPSSGNGNSCGDIVLCGAPFELRIPVTRGLRPYAPRELERAGAEHGPFDCVVHQGDGSRTRAQGITTPSAELLTLPPTECSWGNSDEQRTTPCFTSLQRKLPNPIRMRPSGRWVHVRSASPTPGRPLGAPGGSPHADRCEVHGHAQDRRPHRREPHAPEGGKACLRRFGRAIVDSDRIAHRIR